MDKKTILFITIPIVIVVIAIIITVVVLLVKKEPFKMI